MYNLKCLCVNLLLLNENFVDTISRLKATEYINQVVSNSMEIEFSACFCLETFNFRRGTQGNITLLNAKWITANQQYYFIQGIPKFEGNFIVC